MLCVDLLRLRDAEDQWMMAMVDRLPGTMGRACYVVIEGRAGGGDS